MKGNESSRKMTFIQISKENLTTTASQVATTSSRAKKIIVYADRNNSTIDILVGVSGVQGTAPTKAIVSIGAGDSYEFDAGDYGWFDVSDFYLAASSGTTADAAVHYLPA